jgi:hypothetical protein
MAAPPAYSALSTQIGYGYSPTNSIMNKRSKQSLRSVESGDFPYSYDKAIWTRNLSVIALCFCWVVGSAVAGFGIYVVYLVHTGQNEGHYWTLPHMVAEGIPLGINFVVTLLVETTGYIHTASLRWSLQREGKLTFNSNLRLLSSSRFSGPNKWYSNVLVLMFITLAYASSSLTFSHSNSATSIGDVFSIQTDYVSVAGIPILALGLCLLGLAAMSTWALKASKIPSWSSSPLDTALAAMRAGNIVPQSFRCMRSVHDTREPSVPVYPREKQRGAWSAHSEVKWVLALLWTLVVICFAWAVIVSHIIGAVSPETPGFGGWSLIPNDNSSYLYIKIPIHSLTARALVSIILYALVQGPLTLGLHCAELEMNLSRDEAFWRKATSQKGCRLEEYDSVKAAFTSWQSLLLSCFKPVMHWVFGLCVQVQNGRIYFASAQIVYLALLGTVLATYVSYVSARRPKGPQPAAYGHLQTLVNLVDDWSATLYWGHKNDGPQICHAGTAHYQLPSVKAAPYCG